MAENVEQVARYFKTVTGKDKFMRSLQYIFKILGIHTDGPMASTYTLASKTLGTDRKAMRFVCCSFMCNHVSVTLWSLHIQFPQIDGMVARFACSSQIAEQFRKKHGH